MDDSCRHYIKQRRQTQKHTYYMSPFILCLRAGKLCLWCWKSEQWLPMRWLEDRLERELYTMTSVFCIFTGVLDKLMYVFVKTHQTVHLRSVYFIVYKYTSTWELFKQTKFKRLTYYGLSSCGKKWEEWTNWCFLPPPLMLLEFIFLFSGFTAFILRSAVIIP